MTQRQISIQELIDRIKTLPKAKAEESVRQFLLGFIGPDQKRDYLRNKFRREERQRVGEL